MRASIVAHGSTDFTVRDGPVQDTMMEAIRDLFKHNPGVRREEIDAVLVSTNDGSGYLSAILSEMCDLRPRIAHTVESLCSSGASALVSAVSYIESGLARSVLVIGGDRLRDAGRALDWDAARGGFKSPVFWASIFTRAYKRRFDVAAEELAAVPARNRQNARDNPHACSASDCTVKDVIKSRCVTDDLRLLDCSRPCTGASALLLNNGDTSERFESPVRVLGIGHRTASASAVRSRRFFRMETVAESASMAYASAGIGPSEVDVAEVHDAFSVCEPMAVEALGLAEVGCGAKLASEMLETGDKRVNPRGGILGSGHPPGATGVAQAVEIVAQLQSRAGRRQVQGARTGLIQNMSAAATSSSVVILGT